MTDLALGPAATRAHGPYADRARPERRQLRAADAARRSSTARPRSTRTGSPPCTAGSAAPTASCASAAAAWPRRSSGAASGRATRWRRCCRTSRRCWRRIYGVPMCGRRAQRAQHPARRRPPSPSSCSTARPRRCSPTPSSHRSCARRCAQAGRQILVDRRRRPGGPGRRAAGRASTTRPCSPRATRLRAALPGRRVAGDRAQLHLGHHRQSQGRRLPPSRRASERGRQRAGLEHAALPGLSVDAADVPLQRLVLPLVDRAPGRHAGLPAPGRERDHLRGAGRARHHPSLRCPDRHGHAGQRARERRAGRSPRRCG